ncbi:MAG: glucose-1-phosphate adenylyltransferase [bacterium]
MFEILRKLSTFVMAGGKGERLYPLTRDRAKPAVPFGGIYRIIDFTLSNCINSGIRRINILTQYKSVSLARHIKMGWNIFNSELDEYIDVIPAQQRVGEYWYRGTADAIYQNFYTIEREDPEYVLILAGDHIYKMDYSKMLRFHIERKAEVTVGVVKMPRSQSTQLGVLDVDWDNRIVGFEEKPVEPRTIPGSPDKIYASMGIYIFNTATLFEELIPEAVEEGSRHDFGRDILPQAAGRRRLFAYPFVDENLTEPPYWRDIGTLEAYYEANLDLVAVTPHFNLYDKRWPVRTYQPQFPPVKMVFADEGENARRGQALDSVISSGCIISGGKVSRSVLSAQVRINSFALVEESVLMESVNVGRYARIRRAIIDKYVDILPGTRIGYDLAEDRKRFFVTDSGIVVIPKGRIIGAQEDRPRWQERLPERMLESSLVTRENDPLWKSQGQE